MSRRRPRPQARPRRPERPDAGEPSAPDLRPWWARFDRISVLVGAGFLAILLAMGFVRNHYYFPGHGYVRTGAFAISGDEPHYLMVLNSLLFDKDLDLRQDYQRVRHGGREAGIRFRGAHLDHHTFVLDEKTGNHSWWHGLYLAGVPEPCPPDNPDCTGYRLAPGAFVPSPTAREVSFHPMAFPALLAALVAPRSPNREEVEGFASDAIILLSWLGMVITYVMARRLGFGRLGAFVTSSLLLASPWLAYSRSYFAEVAIGLVLALGLFAMKAERMVLAGLAVVVAIALKPAFVVVAAAWGLERLWARRIRDAVVLSAVIGAGVAAILAFNYWYAWDWRVPPAVLMGGSLLHGAWVSLLGEEYGLLRYAPWAAATLLLLPWMRTPPDGIPVTFVRQILLPLVPYVWLICGMAPGYGASCYGPRYYVCVMPFFALAAGLAFRAYGRFVRVGVATLAIIALTISIPGWIQYGLLWDKPATAVWDTFSAQK